VLDGEAMRFRSVLVADDDVLLLAALARSMRGRGIDVYTATSRALALDLARLHRPDWALVDLQLGHDNGLDLLRDLRAFDQAIQLILITGHSTVSNTVEAMRAGARDVVPKPFTVTEIFEHVRPAMVEGQPRHQIDQQIDHQIDDLIETASVDRVIYEHVHRVLVACAGNQSEAARQLQKPRS
jgi:two-component system response regulator RegA